MGFGNLPEQVAYTILETLPSQDLNNIAMINKRYHSLLLSETFWKSMCFKRYQYGSIEKDKLFQGEWRLFYVFQKHLEKCIILVCGLNTTMKKNN